MWWHVLLYAAVVALVLHRLRSREAEKEIVEEPESQGRVPLSQYLTGFADFSERVPMVMWVTEEDFVFVDARHGWDHGVHKAEVVCVVPRTGIEQVTLFRGEGAAGLMHILGQGEGLELLLSDPEDGLVLLQLELTDQQGVAHDPVFLLDTGAMEPGEEVYAAATIRAMCPEPRPGGQVVESGLTESH